jgi:hypothetical protein
VSLWYYRYQDRYRQTRTSTNGKPHKVEPPKVGESVECIPRGEKIRKCGCRAKLAQGEGAGPIANTRDVA